MKQFLESLAEFVFVLVFYVAVYLIGVFILMWLFGVPREESGIAGQIDAVIILIWPMLAYLIWIIGGGDQMRWWN